MTRDRLQSRRKSQTPVADALLDWYDENARELPWRVGPRARREGERPDPYRVWLSEIMLQQTTVATVAPRYAGFLAAWPSVVDLARASIDEVTEAWAGLGYYARARNLHACARVVVDEYDGRFPETAESLQALPGIGPYTAAAIAAIAFDEPVAAVDGNVERVTARLFEIDDPLPGAKRKITQSISGVWPRERSGDFAQALMDLGSKICTPRAPTCLVCPLRETCRALASGDPERLPVKAAKVAKPRRKGVALLLEDSAGRVLFERRPAKGLLGGMLGLPGPPWREGVCDERDARATAQSLDPDASWRSAGVARHTFTHFHLELDVWRARATRRPAADEIWLSPSDARTPTVMRKALKAGLD